MVKREQEEKNKIEAEIDPEEDARQFAHFQLDQLLDRLVTEQILVAIVSDYPQGMVNSGPILGMVQEIEIESFLACIVAVVQEDLHGERHVLYQLADLGRALVFEVEKLGQMPIVEQGLDHGFVVSFDGNVETIVVVVLNVVHACAMIEQIAHDLVVTDLT